MSMFHIRYLLIPDTDNSWRIKRRYRERSQRQNRNLELSMQWRKILEQNTLNSNGSSTNPSRISRTWCKLRLHKTRETHTRIKGARWSTTKVKDFHSIQQLMLLHSTIIPETETKWVVVVQDTHSIQTKNRWIETADRTYCTRRQLSTPALNNNRIKTTTTHHQMTRASSPPFLVLKMLLNSTLTIQTSQYRTVSSMDHT